TAMNSRENLVACNHTVEETDRLIGADTLGYLPVEDLCYLLGSDKADGVCDACFTNHYPTEIPAEGGKSRFEYKISEGKGRHE
ncbi:MAG: amidophosphoribosyltransferase, partial [Oscillospiraceae bacterium]|nr:amidophosphoribosyltransferase [Oscillospiraceae bacterium]